MFYIEGTVDKVEIQSGENHLKGLSIVPASGFVVSMHDGKKKAVFVEYTNQNRAYLCDTEKSSSGKDVIVLNNGKDGSKAEFVDILLQAKFNHSTLRICVEHKRTKQWNVVEQPDLDKLKEIHFV